VHYDSHRGFSPVAGRALISLTAVELLGLVEYIRARSVLVEYDLE
jgi:hypothetical protein